jgi:hypothetical protein
MVWGLLRRLSPLKKMRDYVRGVDQREVQRRSDLYRLFLVTQLRARMLEGGGGGGRAPLPRVAEELVKQVGWGWELSGARRAVGKRAVGRMQEPK